jgi:1-acyl-sn-glycerol-3-phosphate acyltransferase
VPAYIWALFLQMSDLSGPPASYTYRTFRGLFQIVSHIFFREIKTTDLENVPTSGPCIFIVGPHANQFVDGVVFLSNNPRPSYALMAAVSYDKPLIGHVGKILNSSKFVHDILSTFLLALTHQ